jgi:peptidoglycan/LPS O-acetylase OafA/YrhL
MVMMFMYGVGIWFMEKDSRRAEDYVKSTTAIGAVFSSVYFSFALLTGSGGHSPATKGARALSVSLGFAIVVIIAAYTVSGNPKLQIQPEQ